MQAVDGYGGVGKFCRQVEGETDQGELAAIVRPRTRIAVIHTQICKVWRCLPSRRDIDDPRWCSLFQNGNQSSTQQRRCEGINCEPQLVAICAQHALAIRRSPRTYPCIVDQQMNHCVVGTDPVGEGTGLLQRAEIGQIGLDAAVRCPYLIGDILSAFGIATRHEHVHAPLGKRTGDRPTKAGGRSSDQGNSGALRHFPPTFHDRSNYRAESRRRRVAVTNLWSSPSLAARVFISDRMKSSQRLTKWRPVTTKVPGQETKVWDPSLRSRRYALRVRAYRQRAHPHRDST